MNTLTNKSLATLTLTVLTSLSLQVIAAEPAPNPADYSSIKISFHDLDFNNSEAVAALYRRIQTSARIVCIDSSSPWDASRQETLERCYTAAVEDGGRSGEPPAADGSAPRRKQASARSPSSNPEAKPCSPPHPRRHHGDAEAAG